MSYHYSPTEDPGSYESEIAKLPEANQDEARDQLPAVKEMVNAYAELYGMTRWQASINGAHSESWVSVNVMLTKSP